MTKRDFEAIAKALREEDPRRNETSEIEWDYAQHSAWDRGRYDEWRTCCLAMAQVCEDSSGLSANGNRLFDRDMFLAACEN